MDRSPNLTTCLIPRPSQPMMPNGIQIRSAIMPQCTGQTDRPTDRPTHVRTYGPTDRPQKSLTTIGRCAMTATRPTNNKKNNIHICIPPWCRNLRGGTCHSLERTQNWTLAPVISCSGWFPGIWTFVFGKSLALVVLVSVADWARPGQLAFGHTII